ncbi:MAG: FeoA family protein [Candidatus Binatia bacterium]
MTTLDREAILYMKMNFKINMQSTRARAATPRVDSAGPRRLGGPPGENESRIHRRGASVSAPLISLPPGREARLCAPADGREIPRRLQDLGFVPGTPVVIRRRAPLGDPVEIEIRGYRLCLRLAQLDALRVEDDATERSIP